MAAPAGFAKLRATLEKKPKMKASKGGFEKLSRLKGMLKKPKKGAAPAEMPGMPPMIGA